MTTFVECLACFRPDIEVIAELDAIAGEDGDEEPPDAGVVPSDWVEQRCIGIGRLVGDHADIGHHEALASDQPWRPESFTTNSPTSTPRRSG